MIRNLCGIIVLEMFVFCKVSSKGHSRELNVNVHVFRASDVCGAA